MRKTKYTYPIFPLKGKHCATVTCFMCSYLQETSLFRERIFMIFKVDNLLQLADQRELKIKKTTLCNKYNFQCKQKKNFVHILFKISSFWVNLYTVTINLHINIYQVNMIETQILILLWHQQIGKLSWNLLL